MRTPRSHQAYAPRTRAGLLISCAGFAVLAASAMSDVVRDVLGPVMGVGFVAAVLAVAYLPRLIRPGDGWLRAQLPARIGVTVYVAACATALATVAAGASSTATGWGVVGIGAEAIAMLVTAFVPREGGTERRGAPGAGSDG